MDYKNFFRWLELAYRIEVNKNQDLYEQSRKIIQKYKEDQYLQSKYKKY